MYDNDYIVLVDENGQPYIAHAFGDGVKNYISNRKEHKYKQRFDNYWGPGKHAYAYTDAEVKLYSAGRRIGNAAKNAAKKAGRYIDDHDAGLTERMQAGRLSRQSRRASRKGYHDDATEYANRAAELRRQSREEYENSRVKKGVDAARKYGGQTLTSIRNAGERAGRYIDDHDAGLTERMQAGRLSRQSRRASRKGYHDDATEYANRAAELRRQSREEYENSRVKKGVDAARNAASSARGAATTAAGKVSGAASSAGGSIGGVIHNAQNLISDVIDQKLTGKTAGQNLSQATQNALMGLDGAMGEYADAQHAYEQSMTGGSAAARRKAAEALNKAKENVSNLLSKTGNLFSKSEKAQIQGALQYDFDPVTGEWVPRGR